MNKQFSGTSGSLACLTQISQRWEAPILPTEHPRLSTKWLVVLSIIVYLCLIHPGLSRNSILFYSILFYSILFIPLFPTYPILFVCLIEYCRKTVLAVTSLSGDIVLGASQTQRKAELLGNTSAVEWSYPVVSLWIRECPSNFLLKILNEVEILDPFREARKSQSKVLRWALS